MSEYGAFAIALSIIVLKKGRRVDVSVWKINILALFLKVGTGIA